MKNMTEKKTIGLVFVILTIFCAVASFVRYLLWAVGNDMSDKVVIAALLLGILLDLILLVRECDYLIIGATAAYSVAVARLLTQSVGSCVDAFQGINMFGNAAHVGDIINISIFMGVTILVSVIASCMNRKRM